MSEAEKKPQPFTKVDKTAYGTRIHGVSSTGSFERFIPAPDKKPQTPAKGTSDTKK